MSSLFKLKNELYLTERKNHCGKFNSNRYKNCFDFDISGYFLMYTKSHIHKVYLKLIDYCQTTNINITAQKIISMDLNRSQAKAYTIGWSLAIIYNYYFETEKLAKIPD